MGATSELWEWDWPYGWGTIKYDRFRGGMKRGKPGRKTPPDARTSPQSCGGNIADNPALDLQAIWPVPIFRTAIVPLNPPQPWRRKSENGSIVFKRTESVPFPRFALCADSSCCANASDVREFRLQCSRHFLKSRLQYGGYWIGGSCGIAAPSERGSPAAKLTLRVVSRTTAAPWPTVNESGSSSLI